jgi:hypothetical protein
VQAVGVEVEVSVGIGVRAGVPVPGGLSVAGAVTVAVAVAVRVVVRGVTERGGRGVLLGVGGTPVAVIAGVSVPVSGRVGVPLGGTIVGMVVGVPVDGAVVGVGEPVHGLYRSTSVWKMGVTSEKPTAQMLLLDIAATPFSLSYKGKLGLGTTLHWVPFQCSTRVC